MDHDDSWFQSDDNSLPQWEDNPFDQDPTMADPHWEDANTSEPAQTAAPLKVAPKDSASTDVLGTLRITLAACHGRVADELADVIRQISAATHVLERLSDDQRIIYASILEMLLDASTNTKGTSIDLSKIPLAKLYDAPVQSELARIRALALSGTIDVQDPSLEFFALRESVQRDRARKGAVRYMKALEAQENVEALVERYQKVEPPTTRKAATRSRAAKSVTQMAAEHELANKGTTEMRLSSGYRTLDIAFSKPGETVGFIAPGEGVVVAGPTGTGKSSWTYGVVPSLTQDLINWGKPHAKVLFFHTEEESVDKAKSMAVLPGMPFAHLGDNMVVLNVGTSRKLIAMAVYDTVQDAALRAKETGLPITEFLPYVLVLDYIQSISEQGESEVVSTATTAEYLLRGIQAWNPEEMAKFSGVSYREYTGSPWPEGMEHHRVAGIYMAQLVKQDDKSLLFRPGNRDCQYADFALEDNSETPVWRDPTGAGWSWEVKEGDLRLFKQNAIRGSGIILQNATAIIVLHRSQAYNNPKLPDMGDDGRPHLTDTRARLLLDKTRTGSALKFVPMTFDLDERGFRARYIDSAAEEAMRRSIFTPTADFTKSGDPILPPRPVVSPLAKVRY
jgi:hypothetical protein